MVIATEGVCVGGWGGGEAGGGYGDADIINQKMKFGRQKFFLSKFQCHITHDTGNLFWACFLCVPLCIISFLSMRR